MENKSLGIPVTALITLHSELIFKSQSTFNSVEPKLRSQSVTSAFSARKGERPEFYKMLSLDVLLLCAISGFQLLISADGDPMIEVFKWKQLDFYNRGDGYKDLWNRICIPGNSKNIQLKYVQFQTSANVGESLSFSTKHYEMVVI